MRALASKEHGLVNMLDAVGDVAGSRVVDTVACCWVIIFRGWDWHREVAANEWLVKWVW